MTCKFSETLYNEYFPDSEGWGKEDIIDFAESYAFAAMHDADIQEELFESFELS